MNYQGSPEHRKPAGLSVKVICTVFMAMLFMASTHAIQAQSPEIRKSYRYLDIEQPSKVMPALEKATDGEGNIYYLGLGHILTGSPDKALPIFEKGISEDSKDPLVVAGKGHVKLLQKKTAEGKALLTEAADMNRKKTAEQWKAIGRAYLSDTKFLLDAIAALEKAKAIDNGDPGTHQLLGDAYLLQNHGGESVSSYERAAGADPTWALPLYKIAKVYQRSRNNEIVMDYLQRAVKVDPEFAPAYKELGETYYLQKKPELAVDAYKKYLQISETPGEAKFQYAFFLIMAKKFEEANTIFKEVLNDRNASPIAYKFYARSLLEQKKYDEARKVFDKFFNIAKPEDISVADYAAFGKLLLEVKEDSLANEIFVKGIALDTANQEIDIRELHAKTYYQRKKYQEASEAYEDLLKVKTGAEMPVSAYDMFYMGHSYYLDDEYQEADSAFTKLSELQPNSTLGFLYAAKARAQYDSTGSEGVAVPMYQKYVEIAEADTEKK